MTQRLAKLAGLQNGDGKYTGSRSGSRRMGSTRTSKTSKIDLKVLDKLVNNLLEQQQQQQQHHVGFHETDIGKKSPSNRKSSLKLNRWRPTSRSAHTTFNLNATEGSTNYAALDDNEMPLNVGNDSNTFQQQSKAHMPTIMETANTTATNQNNTNANNNRRKDISPAGRTSPANRSSWTKSLERTPGAIRNVFRNETADDSNASNEMNLPPI